MEKEKNKQLNICASLEYYSLANANHVILLTSNFFCYATIIKTAENSKHTGLDTIYYCITHLFKYYYNLILLVVLNVLVNSRFEKFTN